VMDRFDFLIVGAGFAGSVCAERLASAGKSVLLIDQRAHVGGNAYDEYDDHGVLVHRYGPHIFHTNARQVFDYLSQFTDWRPYEHRVLAQTSRGLVPVPINQTTRDAFGGHEDAAKREIIDGYTRKQWGVEPESLDPSVLARVKTRPDDDSRYFTDRFQVMPAQGYSALFRRLTAHPNIKILLKTSFAEWSDLFFGWGIEWASTIQIIWTGPIDEYFDYRFGKLPYRSAHFEFAHYHEPHVQRVGVVNYPSPDVPYTRVTEFKHLTGQQINGSTVAVEYPQAEGEPLWPMPTAESHRIAEQYRALAAQTPGVHFLGRLGTYRYMNMDQCVAQALSLARTLVTEVAA